MIAFNGQCYLLDKNNPDVDGDRLYDGEEIKTVKVYSLDGKKMTIMGKIYSNPNAVDSDKDGVEDRLDKEPLNDKVS